MQKGAFWLLVRNAQWMVGSFWTGWVNSSSLTRRMGAAVLS
ncbi:hypothetical protein GRAN_3492 [Granulicella sibirica]|uniref:Uncharacterized protein n=1 Tax=Granulicella sibirica TaxID=2479048 RepID=A0A4Q0SZD8_9BACT|nr:hypothetical protein GRAN_3492 [Granulicella sibirica]